MAVFNVHFQPNKLGMSTSFRMILPEALAPEVPDENMLEEYYRQLPKLPVLWLLHGGGGYSSEWLHDSKINLYAQEHHCAVIMPEAQSSLYTNMKHGPAWEDYIAEALPEYIYRNFPVSGERKDNYICGMSMGGYGALRLALAHPQRYSAVASMASAVGLPSRYVNNQLSEEFSATMHAVFGEKEGLLDSTYSLYRLADRYCMQGHKLKIFLCAGREDHTYTDNIEFKNYLTRLKIPYTWEENDDTHNWTSWNTYLPQIMRWLLDHE